MTIDEIRMHLIRLVNGYVSDPAEDQLLSREMTYLQEEYWRS